jgi:DNA replication protein DnaD
MVGGRYINNTENTIQGNPNGSLEDDEEATSSTHQEREAIRRRWFEAFGVYPSPAIVEMVAWKGRMVCDFDMDVVGEAIRAAALRNADSPLDYILALFADWNRHHIRTMDQLDEYMDGDAG